MRTLSILFFFLALPLVTLPAFADPSMSFDFTVVGNEVIRKGPQLKTEEKQTLNELLRDSMKEIQALMKHPHIVEQARKGTGNYERLSPAEVKKQNTLWEMSDANYKFAREISNRKCSDALRATQGNGKRYSEIFITDLHGLNICQTGKTSDYYQADEGWWQHGFADGRGKAGFEPLAYDESSRTFAFRIYAPVYDPQSRRLIGVAKAMVRKPRNL